MLEFRKSTAAELDQIVQLRHRVFGLQRPLKAYRDIEDTSDSSTLISAYDNTQLVASGRLDIQPNNEALICRLVVDGAMRNEGVGQKLMVQLEAEASRQGKRRTRVYSRKQTVGFYEKCGYALTGEMHEAYGREYPEMIKSLHAA